MKRCFQLLVFLLPLLIVGCVTSSYDPTEFQRTTIKEIHDDPDAWLNVSVVVEGQVEHSVWDDAKKRYIYVFQGKFGNVIKVSASYSPDYGMKYDVWGIVQKDPDRNLPTLVQVGIEPVEGQPRWLLPVMVSLGILLVVGVVLLVIFLVNGPPTKVTPPPGGPGTPPPQDTKTVILTDPPTEMPRTMKYFPGRLQFMSGPDQGKEISLLGRQESVGSVVTIGRRPEQGERKFSHIQVHPSIQTVSRMQAEIWHISGQVVLKNLSGANQTVHNGTTLGLNQDVALSDGDVIRMGELELKFILN